MSLTHPRRSARFDTVYRLTAEGVAPQPETTHYPLAEAATAIRLISDAEHTGKLVLDIPQDRAQQRGAAAGAGAWSSVRDGSYIITGGRGGELGPLLAEKMASGNGPARRPDRPELSLRAHSKGLGNNRTDPARSGPMWWWSVATSPTPDTAERLVATATATGLPLRGVLHAAAVVEDATLARHHRRIDRPRLGTEGVRRVEPAPSHRICRELDWFCSFSSAVALLGAPGQGAHSGSQ